MRRSPVSTFASVSDTLSLLSHGRPGHIVDTLIAERGQKLVEHPLWPAMRPFLYSVLRYDKAIQFANDVANLPGPQVFDYLSAALGLDIQVRHADRIPPSGGFILVSNHPTGIADGVAMYDLLKDCRPDMTFFANRDAVRVNPRLAEIIIPVEWREEHKSKLKARETLKLTTRAVEEGRATVLFPSGRIAYWDEGKLNERPWKTSAISLARKYNLPILPVNMKARNSGLFYWFARWSTELRDMTVFYELLNKRGGRFDFTVGNLIPVEALDGDPVEVTRALEAYTVHQLPVDPDRSFR
jgi:putative hemolysin